MQTNRLTVVGGPVAVRAFEDSDWLTVVKGRHADVLECAPARFACQFETSKSPLSALQKLSRQHPRLVLLLDYEVGRTKGLAKAKAGELEHCEIGY